MTQRYGIPPSADRATTWQVKFLYTNTILAIFYLPEPEECISEKSTRDWGSGTTPGSVITALMCAIMSKNIMVLNMTTLKVPHRLKTYKVVFTLQSFEFQLPINHGLENYPFDYNIVCVKHSKICYEDTYYSTRIPYKHFAYS